jgi:uncharacterized membrane protein HdeD (DUF308 family)
VANEPHTGQPSADALVPPSKQLLAGVLLLVVGGAFAVVTVQAGVAVVPAIGFVGVVCGLLLVGNAARERRRQALHEDAESSAGMDRRVLLALVLAVVVPPLGIVLGAAVPPRDRGTDLAAYAMLLGAVFSGLATLALALSLRNG